MFHKIYNHPLIKLYPLYVQVRYAWGYFFLFWSFIACVLLLSIVAGQIGTITTLALQSDAEFDANPGLILDDKFFYALPFAFSSAEKIQQYLEGQRSLLANYMVPVTLELDSAVLIDSAYTARPPQFRPVNTVRPFLGTSMRASDVIWRLSRTAMSNSCALLLQNGVWRADEVCYDTSAKPINPGFLLAMIQKESGLIYGTNARLNPNSSQAQFLLDRAVGYYCFEGPRETSCYDENPEWRFYKGFFKQLYFAVLLIRLRENTCQIGGRFAFRNSRGVFQIGNTVQISDLDGQRQQFWRPVVLVNGISCSMYIYTPHISSARLTLRVMRELRIHEHLVESGAIDANYRPVLLNPFSSSPAE